MQNKKIGYEEARDILSREKGFKDFDDFLNKTGTEIGNLRNSASKMSDESIFGKKEFSNPLYYLYVRLKSGYGDEHQNNILDDEAILFTEIEELIIKHNPEWFRIMADNQTSGGII